MSFRQKRLAVVLASFAVLGLAGCSDPAHPTATALSAPVAPPNTPVTPPSTGGVALDLGEIGLGRTVPGTLRLSDGLCHYGWDVFGELEEPCHRYRVRITETGLLIADLTWTPLTGWISLSNEGAAASQSGLATASRPPLGFSLRVRAGEVVLVNAGMHGYLDPPTGAEVRYTLDLRFQKGG